MAEKERYTVSKIKVMGNTVAITDRKQTVYVDPIAIDTAPHDADAVFITQAGEGHFSLEDIKQVAKESTKLIVPHKLYRQLKDENSIDMSQVMEAKPGTLQEYNKGGAFEVLPATSRKKLLGPHKENWCSYILHTGGVKCYVPGEADDITETHEIKCDGIIFNLETANGFDGKAAAALTNKIKPERVIIYGESQYDAYNAAINKHVDVYMVTEEMNSFE